MNLLRRLVALFPVAVLARRNISRASARSILAVAAVIIGVVAVGGIGVGGEAFKQDQLEAYEGFAGTATVDPVYYRTDDGGFRGTDLSKEDLDRMRAVTGSAVVMPVVEEFNPTLETADGDTVPTARVTGIGTPGRFYEAETGEIPENWRRTVVVGSRLAENEDIEVGDRVFVRVDGEFARQFEVAAVLEPQGFTDPLGADRTLFVPLSQFEGDTYDQAIVRVDPRTGSIERAERRLEAEFNQRERRISISAVQERRDRLEKSLEQINRYLLGVGGISLLVAAVTIANTMLMSAIEREGEIGVLRAVGYPKSVVVRLLVTEATILGLVGAAVGVPLTFGVGMVANEVLIGDPLAFTPEGVRYVAVGAAVGVLVAFVAGLYPAWKAANKRPVEALE